MVHVFMPQSSRDARADAWSFCPEPNCTRFWSLLIDVLLDLVVGRRGVAELKMRLDRLEQGKTRLLAFAELLKTNGMETEQFLSQMRARAALQKPLIPHLHYWRLVGLKQSIIR